MGHSGFQVKIINNNSFPIHDMFDGIPYVIPPNKSVNLPYEAACHIFGVDFAPDERGQVGDIRHQMFLHVERRWGWNSMKDREKVAEMFKNIETKLITMKLVERTVGEDDEDEENLPDPRSFENLETTGALGGLTKKPFTPKSKKGAA